MSRTIHAIIMIVPATVIALGKNKDEVKFKSFIALNLLLSSFTAIIMIILIAIAYHLLLYTSSFSLLSIFYMLQNMITLAVGVPMLVVVFLNWRKMLPATNKWRLGRPTWDGYWEGRY